MEANIKITYSPYPILEDDRKRIEHLAKVSLPSKFRSEVTATDIDSIRAAAERSILEGTRTRYATWLIGFVLGTVWVLPDRASRTGTIFTLLRRQLTPLRVTGCAVWNYTVYRTGLYAGERFENVNFTSDIYRTGRSEAIYRAHGKAVGSTLQEYLETIGPLYGVKGAKVAMKNGAELGEFPAKSGATDCPKSDVSTRLDNGDGGSQDSKSAPTFPPAEHLEKIQEQLEKMQNLMAHWMMIVEPQANLPTIIRNIDNASKEDSGGFLAEQ